VAQEGSVVYAFGDRWGPEKKADQYFKFVPGNGIHDIHMNQGNSGKFKRDNGAYQDGCLLFNYPGGKWLAFFFAFQSQTFETDDNGNPVAAADSSARVADAAGKTPRKAVKRVKKSRAATNA
jgi:uncharacterized protein YukJ